MPKLDDYVLPIGKAKIARQGEDVTIVSFGIGMTYALKAAEALAAEGIEAEVIDLRTIRPMDIDTVIASVKKTNRCVTVEEGWPQSSVGSYIASQLMSKAFDYLDAPVITITGKDVPMPYAANLEKLALPSVKEVVEAVKSRELRGLSAMAGTRKEASDLRRSGGGAGASRRRDHRRRALTHPRPSPRHRLPPTRFLASLPGRSRRAGAGRADGYSSIEPELHLGPHVVVPDIAGWRRERLADYARHQLFRARA